MMAEVLPCLQTTEIARLLADSVETGGTDAMVDPI